jgi:hypothetical protein
MTIPADLLASINAVAASAIELPKIALGSIAESGAESGTGSGAQSPHGAAGGAAAAPSTTTVRVVHTVTRKPATATGGATTKPAASAGNGSTGSVSATPVTNDVEFLSPVQIGGQTINMNFDTGSSDLWVFNTQLSQQTQSGHMIYDPAKSPTFKALQGATFSISYGDGSGARGNVGTDTVNIGGATVTNQAIEMATAVSASFVKDKNNNGLVGLAFSKLNTVKPVAQKTFFDNALPNLALPVFTADLKAGAAGSYEFGRIDATKFNGALSWADVNTTNGFWQFSSSKFSVGGGPPVQTGGGQAIADTGTTLMLVNPAVVNAYYGQVQGAVNDAKVGGLTFPCSATLPDLQVDIGGVYMANIPGRLINFAKVDAAGTSKFSSPSHNL